MYEAELQADHAKDFPQTPPVQPHFKGSQRCVVRVAAHASTPPYLLAVGCGGLVQAGETAHARTVTCTDPANAGAHLWSPPFLWCATGLHLPAAAHISISLASSCRTRSTRYPAAATRVAGQALEIFQQAVSSSFTSCSLETRVLASNIALARYSHLWVI